MLDPSDGLLLDLNVYFGNPFPRVDGNGEEMIEEETEEDKPLIKVILNEHQGRQINEPFKIKTTQVVKIFLGFCFVFCCFYKSSKF